MPISRNPGPSIPNRYTGNLTKAQKEDAYKAISQLQYADLWRGPRTLTSSGVMRVDMQGQIPGPPIRYNIQVQVNGIQGNSTVAHADISSTLQENDPANQRGVTRAVIAALNQSLDSGNSYVVSGSIP